MRRQVCVTTLRATVRLQQQQQRRSSTSAALALTDIVALYKARVARGELQADENQLRVVYQLRQVQQQLMDYAPPAQSRALLHTLSKAPESNETGWTSVLRNRSERALVKVLTEEQALLDLDTPKGFMLVGPPGTGKSLIMDLFFDSLPQARKLRRHYEQMLLHLYNQSFHYMESSRLAADAASTTPWSRREEMKARALSDGWRTVFAGGRSLQDPALMQEFVLAQVAAHLIQTEGWLLAFDEFQMVDVAGASLLKSVLEWFWRLGGIVIATSNRLPDDLYQHGVQRQQFLSFISLLQTRSPAIELDSPVDYRRTFAARSEGLRSGWFTSPQKESYAKAVEEVIGQAQPKQELLPVYGRQISVPLVYDGKIARMSFAQVCRAELGPADYLTITSRYHTIILDDVPVLLVSAKNEARRFISLIDALYETKTRLLCLAADETDKIFFPDAEQYDEAEGDALTEEALSELYVEPFRPNISSYEEQEEDANLAPLNPAYHRAAMPGDERHPSSLSSIPAFKSLAIFSGQDERFAFRRAVSRLHEISSEWYWQHAQHQPMPDSWRSWEKKFEPIKRAPQMLHAAQISSISAQPVEEVQRFDLSPEMIRVKYEEGSPGYKHAQQHEQDRTRPREAPPRIAATHIWGIVERWGARAGRWGRGAAAFSQKDQEQSKR